MYSMDFTVGYVQYIGHPSLVFAFTVDRGPWTVDIYLTAVATRYHAACGSHCSAQRQSSSLPVFR